MLDNLEALAALADHRTMMRAANFLHITQSAVSKRIANLEHEVGKTLIERNGRYVELTPDGLSLLHRARPLMSELKEVFLEERSGMTGEIVIDLSGSVLISWGAEALAKVQKSLPGVRLRINSYHASLAVERVRAGECMLALVQGRGEIAPDLTAQPVIDQTVVIVPAGLRPFRFPRKGELLKVIGIETYAEAWRFMERGLREGQKSWGFKVELSTTLQSFSAITQMARAGFGHGLVPRAVAETLGIPTRKLIEFPKPGITVPVSLIGRKSTLGRTIVREFYDVLLKSLPAEG